MDFYGTSRASTTSVAWPSRVDSSRRVPSVTLLPSARVPLPATIALSWSQSPGGGACIDRPGLVHRLEATVGQRRVVQAEPADTAIHGTVGPSADGQGWLAVIDARHGDGSVF